MKSLGLLLLGVVLIFSCKKDPVVTAEKTTLEYLTGTSSKKWKVASGIIKDQSGLEIPIESIQSPCVTDNVLVLNSDKTYELNEGATKCDPTKDPDVIIKSNWNLEENPKAISINKFIFSNYTLDNAKFLITSIDDNKS